jgi:nitrite reductase/ring-hydroxylating ferredoxin subunit
MPAELTLLLSDIPDGQMKALVLDGEEIVVANVGGRCFAFGGVCPHDGGPLAEGELDGSSVRCPWHFTEFDLETGAVLSGLTDEAIPIYKVEIDGDRVRVTKP